MHPLLDARAIAMAGYAREAANPPYRGIEETNTPESTWRPIRIVRPATRCAKLVLPERSAAARSARSIIRAVTASAFAAKIASLRRSIARRADPGRSAREAGRGAVNATRWGPTSYWVRPT